MKTSVIFVGLICVFMSSLIEAHSNYSDLFEYCNEGADSYTQNCQPWNSSAIAVVNKIRYHTMQLIRTMPPLYKLSFTEDYSKEFRKLNLTEGVYSGLTDLHEVTFNNINIDGASGPFINSSSIHYAFFFNNSLQQFPRDFFKGIVNLHDVIMRDQNILTLSKDGLSEITENLWILELSRCNVTTIEDEAFSKFHKLSQLNLAFNLLTELHPAMFRGLGELRRLQLQGNQITTINSQTFSTTLKLCYLYLHNNKQFESLSDKTFKYLKFLTDVTLSGNFTEDKCMTLFEGISTLRFSPCYDVDKNSLYLLNLMRSNVAT